MDLIMTVVNFVLNNIPMLLEVVGAFAIIATATANKADDAIVNGLLQVINFIGANWGKAKNVD